MGVGDGVFILFGLDLGVKGLDFLMLMIYGWSFLFLEFMFKVMLFLDCCLLKFGFELVVVLLDGFEEVFGFVGMIGGIVLIVMVVVMVVDVLLEGVLGWGGMGRGWLR